MMITKNQNNLIKKAKSNDKNAWIELFNNNYAYLHNFICNRINSTEAIDEIISNTWLAAYKYINTFNEDLNTTFKTWLCGIGKNQIYNYYKKVNKDNSIFFQLTLSTKLETFNEVDNTIFDDRESCIAFNKLPNNYKEILQLLYMDDFTHQEVAELLGSNQEATRALAYRAKKALKELLIEGVSNE